MIRRNNHDRMTAPNAKRAGIALTWKNFSGVRSASRAPTVQEQRVAEIRTALLTNPNMTTREVASSYSVNDKTAEKWLSLARAGGAE